MKTYGWTCANVLAVLLLGATCTLATATNAQEAGAPTQQLPAEAAEGQIPQTFPLDGAETAEPVKESGEIIAAPEGEVPAQPENKKLVPATPMGAAAQGADNGQSSANAPSESPAIQSDSATASDPMAPVAMPESSDILEKYTSQSEEQEALPPSNTPSTTSLGAVADPANPGLAMQGPEPVQEKTPEELKEEIRTEAYDAAITGLFPLSPDQVKNMLKRYDETQKVTTEPVYDAPKPEISVQNISLDPGVVPQVIKTAVGNVTTLNILDATGAPWPVQDVTWAGDYEIVEPEQGGHIIRITPMSEFARGNIVIRLLTLKTPLTMTLETRRDVVQYRVDARVPEYGPFAAAPIMQGGKSMVAGSNELTSILDGITPGGAVKLHVGGVDGRTTAYAVGATTYVRTPMTLLSPAWQSSVSSADGMNVYALSNAPVLLLSDGGEFQRATLSEKEDLLDE